MSATMTSSSAPSSRSGYRAPVIDQDWRNVGKWGGLCTLALVLVSLIGMPVGLDRRILIHPVLSLGYLSLLWIPLVLGFVVSRHVELEGVESPEPGGRDLLAGALTGLLGGFGMAVFIVALDTFNLRDPLVNWSPQLLELLFLVLC